MLAEPLDGGPHCFVNRVSLSQAVEQSRLHRRFACQKTSLAGDPRKTGTLGAAPQSAKRHGLVEQFRRRHAEQAPREAGTEARADDRRTGSETSDEGLGRGAHYDRGSSLMRTISMQPSGSTRCGYVPCGRMIACVHMHNM